MKESCVCCWTNNTDSHKSIINDDHIYSSKLMLKDLHKCFKTILIKKVKIKIGHSSKEKWRYDNLCYRLRVKYKNEEYS